MGSAAIGRYLRVHAAETKGTLLDNAIWALCSSRRGATPVVPSQSVLMATAVNDPHTTPLQDRSRPIDDFIGHLPQARLVGCCASRRNSRQGIRIPWCRNSAGQPTCNRLSFPMVIFLSSVWSAATSCLRYMLVCRSYGYDSNILGWRLSPHKVPSKFAVYYYIEVVTRRARVFGRPPHFDPNWVHPTARYGVYLGRRPQLGFAVAAVAASGP